LLVGVMLVGGLDPVNNLLQQQGENEFRRSRAHLHIVHDHISRPGSACSMHVEQMKEHTWLETLKEARLATLSHASRRATLSNRKSRSSTSVAGSRTSPLTRRFRYCANDSVV
jgi:hypothetical protein